MKNSVVSKLDAVHRQTGFKQTASYKVVKVANIKQKLRLYCKMAGLKTF